jgi:hypothetical protein
MARTGFERGFAQARLQGVKTGLGMAGQRTGFAGGISDGTANMDKMQDPVLLASARTDCPYFFWNADNVTLSGLNVTAVTNLLGTFNPNTQSSISSTTVISDPVYVARAVNNNKAAIEFDVSDAFSTNNAAVPSMTNTSEMTMIMVCKPVAAARSILFWKKDAASDPPFSDTVGDLEVAFDGTDITVNMIGNPTTEEATYAAKDPRIKNNWILLTVKARLSEPQGAGSCLDIYVNGTRNKHLVADTITSLPVIANTTWQNSYINFGNNGSSGSPGTRGGNNHIAAGLIIEQWINESEQLRLENYFRDYYGIKF